MSGQERSPVDQLVELLLYAPIGLLYERDEVLPKLVTRGRSQVQLARILGQLAVQRGQGAVEDRLVDVLGTAGTGLAKAITELGVAVGLAPPDAAGSTPTPPTASTPGPAPTTPATDGVVPAATPAGVADGADEAPPRPLPIAGYDTMAARDIIPLLADLSPAQRLVVRDHERANRGRKTILHKIEQLEG